MGSNNSSDETPEEENADGQTERGGSPQHDDEDRQSNSEVRLL